MKPGGSGPFGHDHPQDRAALHSAKVPDTLHPTKLPKGPQQDRLRRDSCSELYKGVYTGSIRDSMWFSTFKGPEDRIIRYLGLGQLFRRS